MEYKAAQSEIKHTALRCSSRVGACSNDLPHSLQHCDTKLFTGNTTVYFYSCKYANPYMSVNTDLSILDDWLRANQMSANPSNLMSVFSSSTMINLSK